MEIFAPIIRRESLRIFLAIVVILGIIFMQMDIIGAYLKSTLSQNERPIYMRILQRYLVDQESLVCKIPKNLYRFKQVGRLWNKIITKFFKRIDFTFINAETCILTVKNTKDLIIVAIYIDDLACTLRSINVLNG